MSDQTPDMFERRLELAVRRLWALAPLTVRAEIDRRLEAGQVGTSVRPNLDGSWSVHIVGVPVGRVTCDEDGFPDGESLAVWN